MFFYFFPFFFFKAAQKSFISASVFLLRWELKDWSDNSEKEVII